MTELELNANQRAVLEAKDRPMLVVAGPGSGKTTVLQARIERELKDSHGSRFRILGVTFTTVAARAIEQRLEGLSDEQRDRVEVGTFHKFAAKVLRQHGSHVGLSPDFTIISAREDRLAILKEVLKVDNIHSDPRAILALITSLYEKAAEIDGLGNALESDSLPPFLPAVFSRYLELSVEKSQLDFSLLIYLCIQLFRKYPSIPTQLRRVYKRIYVDEFQDTNDAQFVLLDLLAGGSSNGLLFLADQDQLIYEWNGASPERLRDVQSRFEMEVLLLPTSFRCPNEILEPANNLITHNSSRFVKPTFISSNRVHGSLQVVQLADDRAERDWLAKELGAVPVEQRCTTVVIARARRLLDAAMEHCRSMGVPVMSPVARYEFESAPLVMLHNILRLASVPGSEAALQRICGAFYEIVGRNVDPATIRAQGDAEGREPLDVFIGNLRRHAKSEEFAALDCVIRDELLERKEFRNVSRALFAWAEQVAQLQARTGFMASYELEKCLWIEFEMRHKGLKSEGITLREFVQALDLESKTPPLPNHISFVTAHGAKGLEFSRVYIVGAAENHFPTFQAVQLGNNSAAMEEERRSFFVAITRCRRDLTITFAETYGGRAAMPSRFINEMRL